MPYTIAEEQLALARALDDAALTPSGEIRSLVHLARTLRAVPDPDIDPLFAARLERRLLTEGTTPKARPPVAPSSLSEQRRPSRSADVVTLPRGRFVVRKAVVGAVAAAMLFALPVVSAGSALPGSPLYGVKMATERMELVIARGDVADGFVHVRHARKRLSEVAQLIAVDRDAAVPETLRRYDESLRTGTRLILTSTTNVASLGRLAAEVRRSTSDLSELLDVASAGVVPSIIESIVAGDELSLRIEMALGVPAAASSRVHPVSAGHAHGFGSDAAALGSPAGTASNGAGSRHPGIGKDPEDPWSPTSTGADASCLGDLVEDPENDLRPVCATVEAIEDLAGGSHGDARAGGARVAGCPAADTCGLYALEDYRWSSTGVATLSFVVNPAQPWVTPSEAVAAAVGAARAWSAANPSVRIDYRGTTSAVPTLGDGINQIGWANPGAINTLAQANILRAGNRVVEADIVLTVSLPWGTTHDGPVNRYDIQSVLTHEFGHWLGIEHLGGHDASEQSMFARPRPGDVRGRTLALGDVRAIRAAYPSRMHE